MVKTPIVPIVDDGRCLLLIQKALQNPLCSSGFIGALGLHQVAAMVKVLQMTNFAHLNVLDEVNSWQPWG